MTEETNELNEKDVERIADALYKKMKTKQEKEMKEQHDKEKGTESEVFAICIDCGKPLTSDEYHKLTNCPKCNGTKAQIITK